MVKTESAKSGSAMGKVTEQRLKVLGRTTIYDNVHITRDEMAGFEKQVSQEATKEHSFNLFVIQPFNNVQYIESLPRDGFCQSIERG